MSLSTSRIWLLKKHTCGCRYSLEEEAAATAKVQEPLLLLQEAVMVQEMVSAFWHPGESAWQGAGV